jgi:hypothetical protein
VTRTHDPILGVGGQSAGRSSISQVSVEEVARQHPLQKTKTVALLTTRDVKVTSGAGGNGFTALMVG